MSEEEVIQSSQEDEIELQIPKFLSPSKPIRCETPPLSPSDGSYFSPRGYTFPESTYPDELSFQSQPHSYDGDVEPASPLLRRTNFRLSSAEILKAMKEDWKKTCEELDIPYVDSQATISGSPKSKESTIAFDKHPKERLISQSPTSFKNVCSTQEDTIPSSSALSSSETLHLPTSPSSIRSVNSHRAARRARCAAHNVATLQRLLLQEQRRYRRLLAKALGKK